MAIDRQFIDELEERSVEFALDVLGAVTDRMVDEGGLTWGDAPQGRSARIASYLQDEAEGVHTHLAVIDAALMERRRRQFVQDMEAAGLSGEREA